jgi:hypothetical protein
MYKKWINNSIIELKNKYPDDPKYTDFTRANDARMPMLALIVKLDIETRDPHLFFGVHLYPSIGNYTGTKKWEAPFE